MKKIIVWLLIFSMMFSLTSSFAEERCNLKREDIPIDYTSADILSSLKILVGTNNGLELEREITRAEAVTILLRLYPKKIDSSFKIEPVFDDMNNHWAYKDVTLAYNLGLVNGTTTTTFTPNRTVTGKEFTKMLLSMMGYKNITIENAYDKGKEIFLLQNNNAKSVVYNNYKLLRSDVAGLCVSALITKCGDDVMLKDKLVQSEKYEEKDFNCLYSSNKNYEDSFADRLYEQMPKDKNYMYSPLSINMALMMAANGADKLTKSEILTSCGIDNLEKYNEFSKELINKYSTSDIIKLNIANSIWLNTDNTDKSFSNDFKNTIEDYYSGESKTVTNDNALRIINDWVSDKTNKKITDIIDNTSFEAMLINAIYFKASWQEEFEDYATAKDKFTDRNGNISDIDFMNRISYINYFGNDGVKIAEFPYKTSVDNIDNDGNYLGTDSMDNTDISMYVILSNENINPVQLIKTYKQNDLFKRTYVKQSIPKFKIEYETRLRNILQNIGIEKAFSGDAEFSSMFDNGNMHISDMIHKTYIDVDENGTEAAAVTSIIMETAVMTPTDVVEFKANKPFTFIIYDNINDLALFIGEYAYTE